MRGWGTVWGEEGREHTRWVGQRVGGGLEGFHALAVAGWRVGGGRFHALAVCGWVGVWAGVFVWDG